MSIRAVVARAIVAVLIAGLGGCDPGVHVAWEKDFSGPVDYDCIEKALRAVAPDVIRGSYQSDGSSPRGFEPGVIVTQFSYPDASLSGFYSLDIAVQPDGRVHYWHQWGKLGTEIPAEEQRQVMPLLVRANRSVERRCGLPLAGATPKIGGG